MISRITNLLTGVLIVACCTAPASAEADRSCSEVVALAAMARERSAEELAMHRTETGKNYLAEIVFAARDFELHAEDVQTAHRLLLLMPLPSHDGFNYDDPEKPMRRELQLYKLSENLCDHETEADLDALAGLADRLPRVFAKAVIVDPAMMQSYLDYDLAAIGDPHNDSNIQMEKVCRARHVEFKKALASISDEERERFDRHVFDHRRCKAIALPESDE